MKASYLWLVLAAPGWSMIAIGANYWRLNRLHGVEASLAWVDMNFLLGFALVGVISGVWLIFMLRRTTAALIRVCLVSGYILAIPVGVVFGIGGPFIIPESTWSHFEGLFYEIVLVGAIGVWGALPLVVATGIGYVVGQFIRRIVAPSAGGQ